jgi:hypothetical protein
VNKNTDLFRITIVVCYACLHTPDNECHSPGCAFHRGFSPDFPLVDACEMWIRLPGDEPR